MPGKIHIWDIATILKSVVIGIVLEAILLAPAIPSELFPWSHAGPGTLPGLVGLFLNLPGFYILRALTSDQVFREIEESGTLFVLYIFVIQTLIISYSVFVILRWRKLIKGF